MSEKKKTLLKTFHSLSQKASRTQALTWIDTALNSTPEPSPIHWKKGSAKKRAARTGNKNKSSLKSFFSTPAIPCYYQAFSQF